MCQFQLSDTKTCSVSIDIQRGRSFEQKLLKRSFVLKLKTCLFTVSRGFKMHIICKAQKVKQKETHAMEQQYFPTICLFLCILREFSVITNYFSGLDGRRLLAISCFCLQCNGGGVWCFQSIPLPCRITSHTDICNR